MKHKHNKLGNLWTVNSCAFISAGGKANPNGTDWPSSVESLRHSVSSCDALIVAVGEHNYTIPAPLSNALAWMSRPSLDGEIRSSILKGKPWVLMGSGGEKGGRLGREDFYKSLTAVGSIVFERFIDAQFFGEGFDQSTGDVTGKDLQEEIKSLVTSFVESL